MSGVARAGFIKLAGSIISGIFGFGFVIIVTRGLGAKGTGAFFESVAIFLIASAIGKLGADVGFIRMIPHYRALGRNRDIRRMIPIGVIPVFVVSTGLAVAIFVFAPSLAVLLAQRKHGPALVPYIRVLTPFIVMNAASTVVTSATRGFNTMIPLVTVNNIGRPTLRAVLAFMVIVAGFGGVAVTVAYGLPVAIGLFVALVWLYKLVARDEHLGPVQAAAPTPTGEIASEFWRFAGPRAFAAVFSTTVTWLDTLLLGGLKGVVDAGVYAASTRYINLGSFALTVLYLAISPQIATLLAKGDNQRAEGMYQTSTNWLILASWPIYLTLATFAPFFLAVFGKGFVSGQTALMILSLAQLFAMAAGPANTALLMGGHSVLNTINTSVALVLNVGLNLLLIPSYGLAGAAIAWTVSILANNLAAVIELKITMNLSPIGPGFFIVSVGSAVCYGLLGIAARVVLGATWAGFLLFALVSNLLFLSLIWRYRERLDLTALRAALRTRARRKLGRNGDRQGDPGLETVEVPGAGFDTQE